MKRILNYPGSKWRIADIIIENIPEHTTYLEPFFGSGAVFFQKPLSRIETINDLNERVYNFFKICRDQPDLLGVLKDFKGKFILSGYDNDLYDEILNDCYKIYINAQAEAGQSRTEVLWMNYEPSGQLSLL